MCEIPKETSAKMELATDEVRNPIKQDTKKGKQFSKQPKRIASKTKRSR